MKAGGEGKKNLSLNTVRLLGRSLSAIANKRRGAGGRRVDRDYPTVSYTSIIIYIKKYKRCKF